jgi:tRNA dimethylallyltransferase
MKSKILIILGPTATHKSEVALYLARKFPIEIISADSMQFYRGMDIGTDKVSSSVRDKIPHHLIDIISVEEEFSIAHFKKLCLKTIEDVIKKGNFPLVVGGSGLYIRSLTENFPLEASAPPNKNLREKFSEMTIEELRKFANEIDPVAANKTGKSDRKRLIRIIEYYKTTGKKISEISNKEIPYDLLKIGLTRNRDALYTSINLRVDKMFEAGLVKEVETLRKNYTNWSKTALQAIGYKEVLMYLDGLISFEEAVNKTKQRTRNFAKRQITWFKKEKGVVWFDSDDIEVITKKIEDIIKEFLYGYQNK